MTDELQPLPADLSAYIDRFDGAEYGLVMIAIKRYAAGCAAAAVARERERAIDIVAMYGGSIEIEAAIREGV